MNATPLQLESNLFIRTCFLPIRDNAEAGGADKQNTRSPNGRRPDVSHTLSPPCSMQVHRTANAKSSFNEPQLRHADPQRVVCVADIVLA